MQTVNSSPPSIESFAPSEDNMLAAAPDRIELLPTEGLHPNPRNARTHSKKQIKQIAASIAQFGFNNPILIDDENVVIAGHGRLEAAKHLGWGKVPTLRLSHLSDAEKRAYILADNKIALNAGWDGELLAIELEELSELTIEDSFDIEITGFETGEIDIVLDDHQEPAPSNADDTIPEPLDRSISRRGDLWVLGRHRLLCGDARDLDTCGRLFDGERAQLVMTDPPYNVRVQGHVGGRGKTMHKEFPFASGEMSDAEFETFLTESLRVMIAYALDGTLLYVFMDWRHIELLLKVGRALELELKNVCVWNKTSPGQGSFYRSAHELVVVLLKPGASSTNNVQLGKFGRNRSNVWTFPGVNTFTTGKGDDLALHPTVKPVSMIAEAIKDASKRGQIVFDPFLGSGTTLLAAEKTGRRCYGIEYEPGYVDTAIRRWQQMTGKDAVLVSREGMDKLAAPMGKCFDDLCALPSSDEEAGK